MNSGFRPDALELATIGKLVSRVVLVTAMAMLLPAAVGVALGERDGTLALLLGASVGLAVAGAAELFLPAMGEVRWGQGMVAAGLSWLVAPVVCAVPLHASGHFPSFLHAYFDAMSGLTCAGLSVLQDLDHLEESLNLWRHVMQYLGGQGIILVVLTFFAGGGGAVGMYAGEAREDKILPNVRRTAQFIWRASLVYYVLGASVLTGALVLDGMAVRRALLHATSLFFAAFDTGGFAPRAASVGYYHSAVVEAVVIVLMVAGAVSFAVHYRLWQRDPGELLRNLEARVLAVTTTLFGGMLFAGLVTELVYTDFAATLRRGFFQLISAHTGAGFATVPGALFSSQWGTLAPGALILAMTLGGMAGSTTGGIKAVRIGIISKIVSAIVRRPIQPHDTHTVIAYHHLTPHRVTSEAARAATMVTLLFLALYFGGTVVGLYYGYPLEEALFESTSAAAGVGLSVGITSPGMESPLMVAYIAQMYLGRLEFVSALALMGYVHSILRART